MLQVKNILCDLVDYAYKDNPKLENYKRFYIEVSEQNRNTVHGYYNERTHYIRIFKKKTYICAANGSFDIKDELKEDGFFFDKNKKIWKKEGSKNDLDAYSAKYSNVQWRLL